MAASLVLIALACSFSAIAARRRASASAIAGLLVVGTYVLDYVGRFWHAAAGVARLSHFTTTTRCRSSAGCRCGNRCRGHGRDCTRGVPGRARAGVLPGETCRHGPARGDGCVKMVVCGCPRGVACPTIWDHFASTSEIETPARPGVRQAVRAALVNTVLNCHGSRHDLESLGIERRKLARFRQASGAVVERWTGLAFSVCSGHVREPTTSCSPNPATSRSSERAHSKD